MSRDPVDGGLIRYWPLEIPHPISTRKPRTILIFTSSISSAGGMGPSQPGRCQAIKGLMCWRNRCPLDGCQQEQVQLPSSSSAVLTGRNSCLRGLASFKGRHSLLLDASKPLLLLQALFEQMSLPCTIPACSGGVPNEVRKPSVGICGQRD